MRFLLYVMILIAEAVLVPTLIRAWFPGLPIALEPQPEPFLMAVSRPELPDGVLLQYYSAPLQPQVVAGDTAFLYTPEMAQQAYQGDISNLSQAAKAKGEIVELNLESPKEGRFLLKVKYNDIGPRGATFHYRQTPEGIQPIWANYAGALGIFPILGGRAWALGTGLWWLWTVIAMVLRERRRRSKNK